jgi:phage gp46-like protein
VFLDDKGAKMIIQELEQVVELAKDKAVDAYIAYENAGTAYETAAHAVKVAKERLATALKASKPEQNNHDYQDNTLK